MTTASSGMYGAVPPSTTVRAMTHGEVFLADTREILTRVLDYMGISDPVMRFLLEGELREQEFIVYLKRDDGRILPLNAGRVWCKTPNTLPVLDATSGMLLHRVAKGGIYMGPKADLYKAIAMAIRMWFKVLANGLDGYDGGKGFVLVPEHIKLSPAEKLRVAEGYAYGLMHAGMAGAEVDSAATDAGTDRAFVGQMAATMGADPRFSHTYHANVTGTGVLPGQDRCTGAVAALALHLELEALGIDRGLVAIQGYGKVGREAARWLIENTGHRLVLVSDASASYYNADGIDEKEFAQLEDYLGYGGVLPQISQYGGPGSTGSRDELLTARVDGLVLSAGEAAITEANVHRVRARAISVAANGGVDEAGARGLDRAGKRIAHDLLAGGGGVCSSTQQHRLGLGQTVFGATLENGKVLLLPDGNGTERSELPGHVVVNYVLDTYRSRREAALAVHGRYPELGSLHVPYALGALRLFERAGLVVA